MLYAARRFRVSFGSNPLLLVDALHLVEDRTGELVCRGLATHVAGADLTLKLLAIVSTVFQKWLNILTPRQ